MQAYDAEVLAASKIVGAAKTKLAQTQATVARNWHVLNALENNDEHQQITVRRRY